MLNGDKIRLSVKGNEEQVRKELQRRGVPARYVADGKSGATYWDAPASSRPAIVSWYCEPVTCARETGFPVGTLLFHG